MKKFFWRTLFFLVPFLYSIYVCSQPTGKSDCSTTCFSSEVVSVEEISASCKIYELKVSYSGDCANALSHYTVAVPCGQITDLWNSENWNQVIGSDPTTGLSGFKIDDIQNFGEGTTTSFQVKFTLCNTDERCAEELKCWKPVVAYKASTCVNYETLTVACKPLKASLQHQDATCFGAADGSLAVVIEDGQEPFTFLWSNNSSEQTLTAVKAGEYSVIVKDASGAELTLSATVGQPEQISVAAQVSPASCSGKADGAIDLTVSNGNGPYTYSWNNGLETEDIAGVPAGSYTVTVTDENGCSTTSRFTVGNTSALSLNVATNAADCGATNGTIDLEVLSGTGPFSYQWSNGATTQDLTNVAGGVLYTVTVTDNAGCSAQRSVLLRENKTLSITGLVTPLSCAGDEKGAVDLTVSGGTEPYTFKWSNGATTEDLSNIDLGTYKVTVTDSKGCVVEASYTVETETLQLPRITVQPSCDGEANGSITLLEPVGGNTPYTYEWSTGETGNIRTDLAPGSYTVIVTDAKGCSKTLTLTVASTAPIMATASASSADCSANSLYGIDLSVSGGTAPYNYEWSNGASTEDLQGLPVGTYTVIITDAKGCSISKEVVIEAGTPLSCTIANPAAAPVCSSTSNTLSTSVTGADSYTWSVHSSDNSWMITSSVTTSSITYSAGGENSTATFTLTITKDGCSSTCSYTVSACVPDPSGEEPGGEEPGGEEPGGETPGEDGGENCDECLNTIATLIASSEECRTYEVQVNTDGHCAYDLSHWTIAIPCGNISNYSNSRAWRMEVGQDPTTGLNGLKVDGISGFGKESSSFTVRFTLCERNCDLSSWTPVVGYKAGQCIATEEITINESNAVTTSVAVYPNPFSNVIHFEWQAAQPQTSLDIIDQYGNVVMHSTSPDVNGDGFYMNLEASSLPKGIYYYRLAVDGKVYNGKLSKR